MVLDVKLGDEVGIGYRQGHYHYLGTVKRISPKGVVTVFIPTHGDCRYEPNGDRKGDAPAHLWTLLSGEKEKFLERKEKEQAEVKRVVQEREDAWSKKLRRCLAWVMQKGTLQTVECVNCRLDIVSMPLPDEPCTLVIRFEKNNYNTTSKYNFTAHVAICHSRKSGYTSNGSTTMHSEVDDAIAIAAEWMAAWADLQNIFPELFE